MGALVRIFKGREVRTEGLCMRVERVRGAGVNSVRLAFSAPWVVARQRQKETVAKVVGVQYRVRPIKRRRGAAVRFIGEIVGPECSEAYRLVSRMRRPYP